ncbi:hypothetical protein CBL_08419 [Carabus blaptoides fortunei]
MSQEYGLPSEGHFHAFFNICEDILHEELNPVPSDEDASANFDAFFKHCIIHERLQSEIVVQVGCELNPGGRRGICITPYLKILSESLVEAKKKIELNQDKSKFYTDKSRGACTFYKSKDLVLLKIHPISSTSKGVAAKLMPRRDGPYEIDKAVSPTTFILSDPHTNRKVGKYHVSDLTPFFGQTEEIPESTVPKKQRGRPRKLLSSSRGRQTEARGGEV